MEPQDLLLVGVLTTAGTTSFAPFITAFIGTMKGLKVPGIEGNEPRVAAIVALLVVVLALVQVTSDGTMPLGLLTLWTGFTSWYALTRLAMTIHDDISAKPRSLSVGLAGTLAFTVVLTLAAVAILATLLL